MVGCLIAVACMIVVSLSAGNVQSDMVPGDLGPVAAKLGIQQENGYYDLAKILGAILENLPTQSVAPVDWAGASRVVRTAADVTLSFRTVPGAACRLYVLYEGTGDCKRAMSVNVVYRHRCIFGLADQATSCSTSRSPSFTTG